MENTARGRQAFFTQAKYKVDVDQHWDSNKNVTKQNLLGSNSPNNLNIQLRIVSFYSKISCFTVISGWREKQQLENKLEIIMTAMME